MAICGLIGWVGGRSFALKDWTTVILASFIFSLFLAYSCISAIYYGEVNPHGEGEASK